MAQAQDSLYSIKIEKEVLKFTQQEIKNLLGGDYISVKFVKFKMHQILQQYQTNNQHIFELLDIEYENELINSLWNSKVFNKKYLLFPVKDYQQYSLFVLDLNAQVMYILDSLQEVSQNIFDFISSFIQQKLNLEFQVVQCKVPIQINYTDSGIFMLKYLQCIEALIQQQDMDLRTVVWEELFDILCLEFERQRMVNELQSFNQLQKEEETQLLNDSNNLNSQLTENQESSGIQSSVSQQEVQKVSQIAVIVPKPPVNIVLSSQKFLNVVINRNGNVLKATI